MFYRKQHHIQAFIGNAVHPICVYLDSVHLTNAKHKHFFFKTFYDKMLLSKLAWLIMINKVIYTWCNTHTYLHDNPSLSAEIKHLGIGQVDYCKHIHVVKNFILMPQKQLIFKTCPTPRRTLIGTFFKQYLNWLAFNKWNA